MGGHHVTRLRQVKTQVRVLGLAVAMAPQRDPQGDVAEDRAFYKTAAWQRKRMAILVRDMFTCQWPGCGKVYADTSQLVADHKVPVRVDPAGTWDDNNLWCLCKTCHDGPKQAQDVAFYGLMGQRQGWKGRGG